MRARLWTALLMLVAVFATHGLQCTSIAVDTVSAGAKWTPAAAVAVSGVESTTIARAVDDHPAGSAVSPLTRSMAADPAVPSPASGGHDTECCTAPHDMAGQLSALCLAVLAAGITVLLALLIPRLVGLTPPAPHGARAHAHGWVAPMRPPDLSTLCLLRI
ncbi:MAG: hypothetical protein JWR45_2819 [Blastococcus sp.]|nr:hypothetical protein [Blastococcus sp.]